MILADNKHLRNMAEEKGFTVVGVGGILLRAKQAYLMLPRFLIPPRVGDCVALDIPL